MNRQEIREKGGGNEEWKRGEEMKEKEENGKKRLIGG